MVSTNTPVVIVQAETPVSGTAYPAPVPEVNETAPEQPTAYPGPAGEVPAATPFPTAYVPPVTRESFQMATMTPTDTGQGDSYPLETGDNGASGEDEALPRLWLYIGFGLALLALLLGLLAMLRVGQKASGAVQSGALPPAAFDDEQEPADESE
jgi:hypothetical protein